MTNDMRAYATNDLLYQNGCLEQFVNQHSFSNVYELYEGKLINWN